MKRMENIIELMGRNNLKKNIILNVVPTNYNNTEDVKADWILIKLN